MVAVGVVWGQQQGDNHNRSVQSVGRGGLQDSTIATEFAPFRHAGSSGHGIEG
jgi:hypothetical protein